MSNTLSNPAAFPLMGYAPEDNSPIEEHGMTLRDYFAAKTCAAMVSTIANDDDYVRAKKIAEIHSFSHVSEWFAHDAYKQADAMLAEREIEVTIGVRALIYEMLEALQAIEASGSLEHIHAIASAAIAAATEKA